MKESITRWHERIRALLIVCVELNQKLPRRPAPLFEISWSISVGPFTACPCATTLRHCRPNAIAENEADDHQKFHFLWPKKGPGAEGNVCRVASFLFSQSAKLTNVSVEEIGRNYFIIDICQRTKTRSNIRAVWHLDEFVAQNARALCHVHLFPADSAVHRIFILGHGFLVCNNFIQSPAVGAFNGLSQNIS
jgi:hypothetical protein